ncbi:MAG: hypothetical protein JXR56_03705 [Candidatus Cloacimonetes bacterium]|nr:hypothetical protein [Candidatus Cloacimonadota bacterium]
MKRIITIIALISILIPLFAYDKIIYRTQNFSEKGTRRLIKKDQRKVYYYRSEKGKDLVMVNPSAGEYTLKTVSKVQENTVTFDVVIDGTKQTVNVSQIGFNDKYAFFKDYVLTIPKNTKEIRIVTKNRNAYFRFFKKAVLKLSDDPIAVKPSKATGKIVVKDADSNSDYYMADQLNEVRFDVDGEFNAYFYVRAAIVTNQKPAFDIYQNGELIRTETIELKKSGTYHAQGFECLSIGRRIDLMTVPGKNTFRIVPQNSNPILLRIMKIRKKG